MSSDKEYVLSLSYGKGSLACLRAIEILGLPLDRIVHAEVWATDTIPADLPPVVEAKKRIDDKIFKNYKIKVEHVRAKRTYEECFYQIVGETKKDAKSKNAGLIYGFPFQRGAWCNSRLKMEALSKIKGIHYLGIAADEPLRIKKHINNPNVILPLYEIDWEEDYCGLWCQLNDLLSPIYTTSSRGGCWFCHNQSVEQLRQLRKNYPEYWSLLLKWDNDSPVTFRPDGHTVHDFDERFLLEDEMLIDPTATFRWKMLNEDLQYRMF